MDLKVNSVNFSGKKDILYAVRKAADEVHSYSIYMQPRLIMHGENNNTIKHKAAAKAYLDMAVRDKDFIKFVFDTSKTKLQNELKKYFEPLQGGIKPLDYFKQFIMETVSEKQPYNPIKRELAADLVQRISEL